MPESKYRQGWEVQFAVPGLNPDLPICRYGEKISHAGGYLEFPGSKIYKGVVCLSGPLSV
jgi:hypothetical protein